MKTNSFNICPTCTYREACALTDQKNQVWSCSEYNEGAAETPIKLNSVTDKKAQPIMAMA